MSTYKSNDDFEILTEDGFKSFVGMTQSDTVQATFKIVTKGNKEITATENHSFYVGDDSIKTPLSDIAVGDMIQTIDGLEEVIEIKPMGSQTVYDMVEVQGNNTFICNDIVTKNCDELAFVKSHLQDEFWDSIYPTLSCLTGDTLILTESGYRRMDSFFESGDKVEEVIDHNNDTLLYTRDGMFKPSHRYISPPSEILTIETHNGRKINLTKNHPLMFWDTMGAVLKPSANLRFCDILRVDYNTNCFGAMSLPENDAYMSGYAQPTEVKTFGKSILSFDEKTTKNFLSGFVDGKMKTNLFGTKLRMIFNKFSLAQEFQLMLSNVGIYCVIRKDNIRRGHELLIDVKRNDFVNILGNIKVHEKLATKYNPSLKSQINSVYSSMYRPLFDRIVKECGSNNKWFKQQGIRVPSYNGLVKKSEIKKFKDLLVSENIDVSGLMLNVLDELIDSNAFWEKIVAIDEGWAERTYDFTVPDSGTFLQNGIMGSNTGGSCIISSTPNGSVNLFAQLWRKWKSGRGSFKGMYVPWDAPPGRDEAFKKEKIETLGQDKWEQEYECKFLSSDGTLIDTSIIEKHEQRVLDVKPEFKIEEQVFWKKIHPEKTYVVGCDPATGSKKDFSVIEVFEFPSMEQVMEFRDDTISPVFLYSYMKKVVNFLYKHGGEVYWSFENNSVGMAMVALYETDETPPDASLISEPMKNKVGFHTSNASKVKACLKLKEMFEAGKIVINSSDFITELQSYVRKGSGYEAQVGATDDCISAFLIILRILEEMSQYDAAAYFKLYGFEEEREWVPEKDNIDDNPLPFII